MKRRPRKNNGVRLFWRDAYLAGDQVTFGIVAALWFIPPFDKTKIILLSLNSLMTAAFIIAGVKSSK